MSQRVDSLYKLVTFPVVYDAFQSSLGGHRARIRFVTEVLRPETGMKILDVGCGPASVLPFLPQVDYTGIDLNPRHIEFARTQYAGRGRFLLGNVADGLPIEADSFDRIIVGGVLHHLSDDECTSLFKVLVNLVAGDGEIVTIDPVKLPRQRLVARLMNHYDSGLNIRESDEYIALAQACDLVARGRIYNDMLRIPYDHFCMNLHRADLVNVQRSG